jgi:type IX secretion system PorP/SprF family membrane protein
MGTTKINLSLSGVVYLDNYNTLSTGLTAGWAQRSISPDGLMWDSQFQGLAYDPTLPSNESFSYENSDFFDFGAGVMWAYGTSASNLASFDKFKAQVGLAYHHLSRPKMDTYYGATEKLYGKFALHGNLNFAQKYSKLAFQPRFTAFKQGPSFEVNLGMMFRYLISEGSKYTGNIQGLAIAMGGYYRVGDAFSPSVELEIAGFTIGYAYDFNMSDLRVASNGFGGSEFYLKFQNPNPFFRFSRRPSIR